jgi:phi LC3 family holin
MINWRVRLKNRTWVLGFVSQIMIVVQILLQGLNGLGVTDFQLTDQIQNGILTFVNTIFVILSMLGLIQDPTTKGYKDSAQAKTYNTPK